MTAKEKNIGVDVQQVGPSRYVLTVSENFMDGLKDARLQIHYNGDIGHAFIDGKMINDNFCNGAVWEIGLKDFAEELKKKAITLAELY